MGYPDFDPFKVDWITKGTPKYASEVELYEVVEEEAFNKFGIQSKYYPIDLIPADNIFGESNVKTVIRSFEFMCYPNNGDLPKQERSTSVQGIVSLDLFNVNISIRNFDSMSTYNSYGVSGVYESYAPKIGDLMYFKYNNRFYRVLMVKKEFEIFLQAKHTYTLVLEQMKDLNYQLSSEIVNSNDIINSVNSGTTSIDMFQLNNYVDEAKKDILYTPSFTECPPADSFNDWTVDAPPQPSIPVDIIWDGGIGDINATNYTFQSEQPVNDPIHGINQFPDGGNVVLDPFTTTGEKTFIDRSFADENDPNDTIIIDQT